MLQSKFQAASRARFSSVSVAKPAISLCSERKRELCVDFSLLNLLGPSAWGSFGITGKVNAYFLLAALKNRTISCLSPD